MAEAGFRCHSGLSPSKRRPAVASNGAAGREACHRKNFAASPVWPTAQAPPRVARFVTRFTHGGCALANGGAKIRQIGGASGKGTVRRFFYAIFSCDESNRTCDAGLELPADFNALFFPYSHI